METEQETKQEKIRTYQTEKALRVLFKQISDHCISVGLDQNVITTHLENYSIATSPQWVNELWRTIMVGLTGKTSKRDLTQKEVEQVYQEFNKFWSEVTGENFSFPNWRDLMLAQYDNEMR